jgi:hypothetical protein
LSIPHQVEQDLQRLRSQVHEVGIAPKLFVRGVQAKRWEYKNSSRCHSVLNGLRWPVLILTEGPRKFHESFTKIPRKLYGSSTGSSTELPRCFYGLKRTSALLWACADQQERQGIQKETKGGNRETRFVAEELAGSGLRRSVSRPRRIRVSPFRRTSRARNVRTKYGIRNA